MPCEDRSVTVKFGLTKQPQGDLVANTIFTTR